MAGGDCMLQREGLTEGWCVRHACIVCLYVCVSCGVGGGVAAGEGERERKNSAICMLIIFYCAIIGHACRMFT